MNAEYHADNQNPGEADAESGPSPAEVDVESGTSAAEAGARSDLVSRIRPLPHDAPEEVFIPFLDLCFNWSMDKPRVEIAELRERDDAAFYFRGWGRHGDIAVAAYSEQDAEASAAAESSPEIVGLAWLRIADIDAVIDKAGKPSAEPAISNAATSAAEAATASATTSATSAASTATTSTNSPANEAGDEASDDNAGDDNAGDDNAGDDNADNPAEDSSPFTGYGWVAADIPELSIAVLPDHQSQGIGGTLLEVLCTLARMSGFHAVSLSVEDGNGAARLYHDHRFTAVGRHGNSDILVRNLG